MFSISAELSERWYGSDLMLRMVAELSEKSFGSDLMFIIGVEVSKRWHHSDMVSGIGPDTKGFLPVSTACMWLQNGSTICILVIYHVTYHVYFYFSLVLFSHFLGKCILQVGF